VSEAKLNLVDTTARPRLSLEEITVTFDGVPAVSELSLDVGAGEIVCLLGPSGCGQTTTLRVAAGVERQRAGRVLVDGRVVSRRGEHEPPEARSIGLMFQDFALFPHLTVTENVAFGLRRVAPMARARRWWPIIWAGSEWRPMAASSRTSCPAASSSAWRWPAPWRRGRA
jgi:ABC-type nitrate/sulfonate/bicarbonate transport system ATPase subunit